jgi:predicted CoA-binding protein
VSAPAIPAPDPDVADVLRRARTIAVVGASVEPGRPSFGIVRYLVGAGYAVHPVNPLQAGQVLHGRPILAALSAVPDPIDIVDVFRRSDAIGDVVDDALAAGAPLLWLQLGIRNDAAVARARAAGMAVIENRCISVEHARRLG